MRETNFWVVPTESAGERLDRFVSTVCEISRSAVARLIESEELTLNGKPTDKNVKLRAGDKIFLTLPEPIPCEAKPQEIPLDIVYEDRDLIVVNKPVGMVVHPAAGNSDGTLVNALLYHCGESLSGVGGVLRPGIVHRIDKDTSGLLVVAKNDAAHLFLAEQLKTHAIRRIYQAIAIGNFREESGTVNAPIGRHPTDRKRMAIIKDREKKSREAVTHWKVLAGGNAMGNSFSLVECRLETGRTHQIRVHLSSIGHPLLGDPVYGGDRTAFQAHHRDLIKGQCLHAGTLILTHPSTGEEMTFHAPMPENMKKVRDLIFETESGGKE